MKLDRDHGNDGFDQTVTYLYDANDRLLEEILDDLVTNANDTTTTYTYDHTQQTGKQVRSMGILPMSSEPISSQHFTYNLQGRLSSVINEDYTDGTLSSRTRTNYEYDSKSYRVQINNASGASLGSLDSETWSPTSETSFLADHHNHTGYTQTIRETTNNADGTIKTVDYTFGNDELAQRIVLLAADGTITSDETLVFGHDGHGSVRILYDLASTASNALSALATYSAYGVLLATHNALAGVHATSFTLQTSLGYSGELWDAASQQQYLRARYYTPANGLFNRLDPFHGNMQDPQSLHKYAYVHGDPVQGVDPTGLISLSGLGVSMGSSANIRAQNQSAQVSAQANTGRAIVQATQRSLANAVNVLRQSPHLVRQYQRRIAEHIIGPHTPPGTVPGESLFRTANPRIINNLIDKTLNAGQVSGNTGGRSGLIFTRTFSNPVGTNAAGQFVHTVKVVVSDSGKLISAFPI